MQWNRQQVAIKLLPSMTDFAFLMPIFYLFSRMNGMENLLGDCDTGWHIRTGQWIAAHGAVPSRDPFSYSKPGGVWYAWEWLSDLIFAWLHAHGGLASIALASVLLISVVFALLFRLTLRKSNAVVALGVTLMAVAASSIHWLARPHLFTLLFAVLFYFALERAREGQTKYLWLLPPATALWTNLHGGFVVGLIMIAAYAAGDLLRMVFAPAAAERGLAWLSARRYLVSTGAALAASLLNPYTYHLHVHVIEYLRDPYQSEHIAEFLSISFHHPVALFFEAMMLLGAGAAYRSVRQGTYIEAVLIVLWAHGALLSARNIPIFTIIAAPPVAAAIAEWMAAAPRLEIAGWLRRAMNALNQKAQNLSAAEAIGRWHPVSAGAVAIVAALLFAPNPPKKFRAEFDPKVYPAAAVEKISNNRLAGLGDAHIFTFDQWGDYLIYRLYPRMRVFIDGRSDYYGDDFEIKAVDALNVKDGWDKTLARFGVDTVLLPPSSPLTGALKLSNRWSVIYDDGVAVVFRSTQSGEAQVSAATGRGVSRDREITKTASSGPAAAKLNTPNKSTT